MGDTNINSKEMEQKITLQELRDFALSDSDETRPVVIELDVDFPQVEVKRGFLGRLRPKRVLELSPRAQEKVKEIETAAREKIPKVITHKVKWLSAAHALMARVTPEELRVLVTMKEIRGVRLRKE
ncbi:MAG: hypothetical protein KME65_11425 [Candidatus Thiodiazotropha sp. (ex Ctena orbiculata)]|uniref:Uncharacterized protein n=1 Tax=Candidatus Thiodiazotropha taylori TaxID=2792791 RepID=A0A944M935_9GAMM|nr:hypothetical protein [Candidatus Thiodiazotropha taylori]MBV2139273.1 hypothetical protein [Candidatus Thiodiazotropha taylori]